VHVLTSSTILIHLKHNIAEVATFWAIWYAALVRRLAIGVVLLLSSSAAARDPGYGAGYSGTIQFAYGQHFTGKMIAPQYFPTFEFRFGLDVSRNFTMRLDLGAGYAKIAKSDRPSFEGAHFMPGNFSLVFLYTPEASDSLRFNLGGSLGLWFSAMWGDHDLLGNLAGSMNKYMEALSVSYALVAGAEWIVSDRWALFLEVRGNMAMVKFGQEYNAGGATVMLGFLYRVKPYDP
jgi:opacity protein-like surface antigen